MVLSRLRRVDTKGLENDLRSSTTLAATLTTTETATATAATLAGVRCRSTLLFVYDSGVRALVDGLVRAGARELQQAVDLIDKLENARAIVHGGGRGLRLDDHLRVARALGQGRVRRILETTTTSLRLSVVLLRHKRFTPTLTHCSTADAGLAGVSLEAE